MIRDRKVGHTSKRVLKKGITAGIEKSLTDNCYYYYYYHYYFVSQVYRILRRIFRDKNYLSLRKILLCMSTTY